MQVQVPQMEIQDDIVEVPVQRQVQLPLVMKVQKTVEAPLVEIVDQDLHVHVQKHRHGPMITKAQKMGDVQYMDRIVEIPVQKCRGP